MGAVRQLHPADPARPRRDLARADHAGRTRVVYRRKFIAAFEGDLAAMLVVAQQDPVGWLAWTFYPVKNINSQRKGYLLYRREEAPAGN